MSLSQLAQHIQSRGRGEDKMLVHMTPSEVGGLQSLAMAHGGSLTINPETGLPEASFLSRILPTIIGAGVGMATMNPMLGAAAGGAAGMAFNKGSLQAGLMAGLGSYGLGTLGAGFAGAGAATANTAGSLGYEGLSSAVNAGAMTPAGTLTQSGASALMAGDGSAALLSNPSTFENIRAGLGAVGNQPGGWGQFLKSNMLPIAGAAAPLLMSGMGGSKDKDDNETPSYIRPYNLETKVNGPSYTPGTPYLERTFTPQEPVRTSEWGSRSFADGGAIRMATGGQSDMSSFLSQQRSDLDRSSQELMQQPNTALAPVDPFALWDTQQREFEKQGSQRRREAAELAAAQILEKQKADAELEKQKTLNLVTEEVQPYKYQQSMGDSGEGGTAGPDGPAGEGDAPGDASDGGIGDAGHADSSDSGDAGGPAGEGDSPGDSGDGGVGDAGFNQGGIARLANGGTYPYNSQAITNPVNRYGVTGNTPLFQSDTAANYGIVNQTPQYLLPQNNPSNVFGTSFNPYTPYGFQEYNQNRYGPPAAQTNMPAVDQYNQSLANQANLEYMGQPTLSSFLSEQRKDLERAYREILGRVPDAASQKSYLEQMDQGASLDDIKKQMEANPPPVPGIDPTLDTTPNQNPYPTNLAGVNSPYGQAAATELGAAGNRAAVNTAADQAQLDPRLQADAIIAAQDAERRRLEEEERLRLEDERRREETEGMFVDPNTAYLENLYGKVLERGSDAPGLSYWQRRLQEGMSIDDVTESFHRSQENAKQEVGRFYENILKKEADEAGMNYWVQRVAEGMPIEDVEKSFRAHINAAMGGLMKSYASGGITGIQRYNLGGYSDGGRLLKGPGDGVSDNIPAVIGNKQPARLADGEFVVPARIVSEIGNGSTDAGAKRLYGMMDRIQKSRQKSVGKGKVAVDSKAYKHLPK